jgi:hypothetical protein
MQVKNYSQGNRKRGYRAREIHAKKENPSIRGGKVPLPDSPDQREKGGLL